MDNAGSQKAKGHRNILVSGQSLIDVWVKGKVECIIMQIQIIDIQERLTF